MEAFQAAHDILDKLTKAKPGYAALQRDLALSYENLGNVEKAQNDVPAALASYRAELDIIGRLAKSDPSNAVWQRILSVAYHYLGSAQSSAGDLPGALASFRADLTTIDHLAKLTPANAGFQRDLSIAYTGVGGLLRAQGDLAGALTSYQAGLGVIEALAKSNPANVQLQSDVTISSGNVGETLFNLGRPADAIAYFSEAIQTGKASNSADLYLRRGVAKIESGNAPAAADDLAVAVKLASASAYNVLWLHVARVLAGQDDATEFEANAKNVDQSKSPGAVVGLYLGSTTPEEVFKAAASAEPDSARADQACEADFFFGVDQIGKGAPGAARPLLQSAADHCPHDYFQYSAAKFEVGQIDQLAKAK